MASPSTGIEDCYDWQRFDIRGQAPQDRYPTSRALLSSVSEERWRRFADALLIGGVPDQEKLRGLVDEIADSPRDRHASDCPRVFISHRRVDASLALRAAWLASQKAHMSFWLDVIDLRRSMTPIARTIGKRYPDRQAHQLILGYLQAAVIEMALVNCTHVLAMVTNRSQGSWWVPYEYGRIAGRTGNLAKEPVAAWRHPVTTSTDQLPEYMWLAPIHHRGKAIIKWLSAERAQWEQCARTAKWPPGEGVPLPLPGE